jgi:hypothetical protein
MMGTEWKLVSNGRWGQPQRRGKSVNRLAAQTLDFVLEVQLATLEFEDGQIVDRRVLLGFCDLGLQGFMP